jgi:RNA polymerase sigma-70 factor, ECF subfamily
MTYKADSYYIDRIRDFDDQVAFTHLIKKHRLLVYNIAKKVTRNNEDAEEVTQDTFVKMYKSLQEFRGDSKFTTWLYRIAWNLAASKTRKKSHITASTDEDDFIETDTPGNYSVLSTMQLKDRNRYIKKAIDSLEETENIIITLYYIDDQPVDDIAKITGLTASNIKVKLFRARKKIELMLIQLLDTELQSIIH